MSRSRNSGKRFERFNSSVTRGGVPFRHLPHGQVGPGIVQRQKSEALVESCSCLVHRIDHFHCGARIGVCFRSRANAGRTDTPWSRDHHSRRCRWCSGLGGFLCCRDCSSGVVQRSGSLIPFQRLVHLIGSRRSSDQELHLNCIFSVATNLSAWATPCPFEFAAPFHDHLDFETDSTPTPFNGGRFS